MIDIPSEIKGIVYPLAYNKLLYRPVYPAKSEIYEKRHVVCPN